MVHGPCAVSRLCLLCQGRSRVHTSVPPRAQISINNGLVVRPQLNRRCVRKLHPLPTHVCIFIASRPNIGHNYYSQSASARLNAGPDRAPTDKLATKDAAGLRLRDTGRRGISATFTLHSKDSGRAPTLPTSMPIGEFPACGGDRALPVRVALRMLQGREFEPAVRPNSWRWTHPR